MPDVLDLTQFRGTGLKQGEVELPRDDGIGKFGQKFLLLRMMEIDALEHYNMIIAVSS